MITRKYFLLFVLLAVIQNTIPVSLYAQYLEGQPLIDSLLKELPKAKDDTSKVKTLYSLAIAVAPDDSAAAFKYANQCMNLAKQINWENGIGLSFFALGKICYAVSNFTTSIQNCQIACEIFRKLKLKQRMGAALLTIASGYYGLGYYVKAIENDYAALRLYEEVNYQTGISAAYGNMGTAYENLLDYPKAIDNYNKALATCNKNNKYAIAETLGNIAVVFDEEGKYDSANVYSLRAGKIFEDINDQSDLAIQYCNHGDLMLELYNAKSANEYYNRAMEINKRLGISLELATDYGSIGNLYLTLAKDTLEKYILSPELRLDKKSLLGRSQYYLTKALSLGKEVKDLQSIMRFTEALSETEERLGNYKAALAFHKDYTLYKDSIFNDENKKKIATMEMQRLTEVKDKEIQLQASEVEHQTLIKNIILVSVGIAAMLAFVLIWTFNRRRKTMFDNKVMDVEMKALRAQMNPHFIFNSLQSINKYVIENNKESASVYLSKFSNLMRLILENSREQEVPLTDDLCALELYMQLESLRFKSSFTYTIETDPAIDKENTLIPPMLLQPFVENAIIHGVRSKEKGLIKISVQKENDMIKCVVEDNGNGRKDVIAVKGEGEKKRRSLGIKIINERLNIINHLKKAKTGINIFDLKDADNNPAGLRIELLLPLQLAF